MQERINCCSKECKIDILILFSWFLTQRCIKALSLGHAFCHNLHNFFHHLRLILTPANWIVFFLRKASHRLRKAKLLNLSWSSHPKWFWTVDCIVQLWSLFKYKIPRLMSFFGSICNDVHFANSSRFAICSVEHNCASRISLHAYLSLSVPERMLCKKR